MKFCTICAAITLSITSQFVFAQSTTPTPVKKTATKKAVPAQEVSNDEDDMTPDIKESTTYEYKCELKDSLTIYTNSDDNDHVALRWKNKLYRLKRVVTTTGANRFENKKAGLVWIGIPTKGMLLDSRHGQQLANDCKTAGQ
ncbi:MliC family protein [Solimicrobium silvestre]|uniref:Membrane-bound lysozyme-inhibitor of c-type lysozyme n=1 Tax=Solimicrobium silvestre TaxID=2099400 RepID=A0A2S9GWU9_9BURK|nr:MliC family protein [Solimicrobium silvestre]PRC92178.1 Membrane-bound lysozyme-inhibitor of c-type lysozyme [Solimicrobium silvestre]